MTTSYNSLPLGIRLRMRPNEYKAKTRKHVGFSNGSRPGNNNPSKPAPSSVATTYSRSNYNRTPIIVSKQENNIYNNNSDKPARHWWNPFGGWNPSGGRKTRRSRSRLSRRR